ncbi:hypothetical protein ABY45_06635 [Microbacterium maritypicum]|uniref:hypothetical protein n=1 Tax=Microbacterium maritypicum TaxID=33918 RepID=UPI003D6ED3A0
MELAAFLALAVLALGRLPALGRGGAGTLSELALLTGAGALFMVGTVVPLAVVDGWLGGTNVVNLVRNVLATVAIWFMTMTAKNMANGSRPARRSIWGLIIVIIAFTIPFFLMDRGVTNAEFIRVNAGSGWLWLYASIYMAFVAYMMVRLFQALGERAPRPYAVVRIGAILMCIASIAEIVYLTARVLGRQSEWLGDLFVPLFYGGILLIAGGLAWFPLARRARHAALAIANAMLRRASAPHPALVGDADRHSAETIAHGTYRLAVQLADIGNAVELTRTERWSLRFATHLLNLQVPAPHVIRMSAVPEAAL